MRLEDQWAATEQQLAREAESLGEILAKLRGHISPVLVGGTGWERLLERARGLPATMAAFPFGFELPLQENGPNADFGVSLTRDMAQRIEAGMKAEVEVAAPDGTSHRLEGEVAVVEAKPLPDWLAALLLATTGPAYRVEVALHETSDLSVPDGTPCRIRIELGRDTPAALLAAGPS